MNRWMLSLVMVFGACSSPTVERQLDLVEVEIGSIDNEGIDWIEVRIPDRRNDRITEVLLNFATSKTLDRTVALRRATTRVPSRFIRFEDIDFRPPTHDLWLYLKVQTTSSLHEENTFQLR